MEPPPISVIIPCFNAASTLVAAVESAIAQDVDSEIILIDDGSTDNTADVIRQLLSRFGGRIAAVTQTNQGQGAARNRGIQLARGKYLAFLDADDQYRPGFFARAIPILDQQPATVAVECRLELAHTDLEVEPWHLEAMAGTMLGTMLIRTEIARLMDGLPTDAAFRGEMAGEDGCFRLVLQSFGAIHKLNFVGLGYRVQPNSHAERFIRRARLENGGIIFDYQSAEERDGSFALAIQRYRDAVGSRMIDRTFKEILTEVSAVMNAEALRNHLSHQPAENGFVEGFAMYTFARHWPISGDVLELSTSKIFRSTQWLANACAASGNGKVMSDTAKGSLFRAVFVNVETFPVVTIASMAAPALPLGGLLILYSDRTAVPALLEMGAGAQWKERLRLPRVRAFEKR